VPTEQDGRASKQCPFNGCEWEQEFDAESWASEVAAEVDAEIHWEREHGGQAPEDAEFGENQCPKCDSFRGFDGTVSCRNCGHIPEEARA